MSAATMPELGGDNGESQLSSIPLVAKMQRALKACGDEAVKAIARKLWKVIRVEVVDFNERVKKHSEKYTFLGYTNLIIWIPMFAFGLRVHGWQVKLLNGKPYLGDPTTPGRNGEGHYRNALPKTHPTRICLTAAVFSDERVKRCLDAVVAGTHPALQAPAAAAEAAVTGDALAAFAGESEDFDFGTLTEDSPF